MPENLSAKEREQLLPAVHRYVVARVKQQVSNDLCHVRQT